MGVAWKKRCQILENEAEHPLHFHCDPLHPVTVGRPITKASTLCDVGWLIGVVGCLGFGSTAGEGVARGLSCKSLMVS